MSVLSSFVVRTMFVGLLCGVVLFSSAQVIHAEGWVALHSPVSGMMFGLDCGGGTSCVQVGTGGVVIYTTDGTTWTTGSSGVVADLISVDMYSATIGFAVGIDGTIVKTTDGGATWTSIPGVTSEIIYDVAMASSTTAYIAGQNGAVFKTTDGGTSWTDISSGLSAIDAFTIETYSTGVVYVAGAGGVAYKSTNGGTSWTALTTGTTDGIFALDVLSSTVALIGGENTLIAKTTDGATFSAQSLPDFGGAEVVTDLSCLNSSVCLLVGSLGTVEITADGGATWTEEVMPSTETLGGLSMYAVGRKFVGGFNGALFTYDVYGPNAITDLALSTGGTTTTDTTPTFTWSDTTDDITTVLSYAVDVDDTGTWTDIGDVNSYTVSSALAEGSHTVSVIGIDAVGNDGDVASLTFTVSSTSSDTTAPVVGSVTPTAVFTGVSTSLHASYSDDVGVTSCTGYVDGVAKAMSLSAGTASMTKTVNTAGSYTVYVTCVDAAWNIGTGATSTVVVSAASTDTTAPTVGTIAPSTATQNTAGTFSVIATDAGGIYSCYLMVDGDNQGVMTSSSSTYSKSYTPAASGTIDVYAWCGDLSGNVGEGTAVVVTVAAAAATSTDTTAPTVGAIAPLVATAGTAVTLSASAADSVGVDSCGLYVNGAYIGAMTVANGYATRSYTFADEGNAVANAYCTDDAGNATRGDSSTIEIAASAEQTDEEAAAVSDVDTNTLIKLACGAVADVEDPCHAVYYYDGKRHAFPNEKVFFTWYENFDDVVIVTDEYMASITLGYNVTYHPGSRMVKFITVNTVYGVGEMGELRAIASEDVAESIWGSAWNTLIDDISDAFYGNYRFGEDIDSASDFDPDEVEDSVTNIESILK